MNEVREFWLARNAMYKFICEERKHYQDTYENPFVFMMYDYLKTCMEQFEIEIA